MPLHAAATKWAVVVGYALAGVGFLLGMAACGGEDGGNGPGPDDTFSYPHANGSEWTYTYQGTNAARYVISGTYNHPVGGNTQQLFEYVWTGSQWQDNGGYYLKATANDVKLYIDPQAGDSLMILKFPLSVGAQWDAGLGYSANVSVKENTSVPAGSWSCFKIDYSSTGNTFTFWWASGVGGMGAKNHGWWSAGGNPITTELASYNLPTS